jgi:hypothetical protein
MSYVIATRLIERTIADAMPAIRQCKGVGWTPCNRDPMLLLSEEGEVISLYKAAARVLKPTRSGEYLAVNAAGKTTHIHRLMAETWFGPAPFTGAEVRHLDGNRFNNALRNLAWGSYADQWRDKIRHGTDNCGERNPQAKLTRERVRQMRDLRCRGRTFKSIAEAFGISPMTAHRAITGGSWK